MAGGLWGADVAKLRTCADAVERAGQRLGMIAREIDLAVARVPWTGPAADQFRGEWSGTAKVRLLAVTAVLEVASLRLQGNANAQDDASRPGGTEAETDDAASSDAGGPGNESVEPGLAAAAALPGGAAADLGTSADDGSREDQRQESRRDVSDSGSGTGDPLYGTPGPSPFPLTGLGPGTAGTAVTPPRPPEWHASDLGSDENGPSWNTEDASFGDHAREWAVQQAADLTTPRWPDAARNLHHYLDNSGETLTQPVDTMLDEIPDLSAKVAAREDRLVNDAITSAQAAGAMGPVTYPISTEWAGTAASEGNLFYATGSFDYNLTGQVTVHPPTVPGEVWRYEMESMVNTRDRYNWDGNKATEILGMTVTDKELQEFHRKGLAQEFTMVGQSSPRTTRGTAS